MGKKDKKKQGRGQEKTQQKSEAKAAKRTKKEAAIKGEDDVEALIAEFVAKDKKQATVHVDTGCAQPSIRSSFTFTASPVRDELYVFGGEYYNGKQTLLYNDLYLYSFKRGGEWSLIKAPNPPPPRSSHQTVAVARGGGQLWVFGGEFASPTQSQFYHYNDLWSFSIADMQWTRHDAPARPSPRSGHRMIVWKKLLVVFGGFHEVHDTFKYFNDIHAFDLETYQWVKMDISGTPPSPRSGCQMTVNKQGKILIFGGYSKSKLKKDVEKGVVHTDMFFLVPQEKSEADASDSKLPSKWKWVEVRQSGDRPSPRSGFSLLPFSPAPSGGFARALLYGGVCDEEEDDETLDSVFYNDMYTLDTENGKWYELYLKGEKTEEEKEAKKSRRRRKKSGSQKGEEKVEGESSGEEEDEEEEVKEKVKKVVKEEIKKEIKEENGDGGEAKRAKIEGEQSMETDAAQDGASTSSTETPQSEAMKHILEEGIFTVSIGAADDGSGAGDNAEDAAAAARLKRIAQSASAFVPEERMNAQVVLKNNVAYLYGGMKEDGDKTLKLRDFYSLDLAKLDTWRTIARDERETKMWAEESESSEEEEEEEGAEGGEDEEEEEEDDEDAFEEFWEENRSRFITIATQGLEESGQKEVTKKMIKNRAFQLAKDEFEN